MNKISELSTGQAMSWYHSKILRIPHGNQNPKKRYLTENQILELFSGLVHIQEKVDGKLFCSDLYDGFLGFKSIDIVEDMTGKSTCHKHIEYTSLPPNKMIYLDTIQIVDNELDISGTSTFSKLDYAILDGHDLNLTQIYSLLELLSRLPSKFGRERIEGLVIKNYEKQLMGKWINDEFEDHLKRSKKREN